MNENELPPFDAAVLLSFRTRVGSEPPTALEVSKEVGLGKCAVKAACDRLLDAGLLRIRSGRSRRQWRALEAVALEQEKCCPTCKRPIT